MNNLNIWADAKSDFGIFKTFAKQNAVIDRIPVTSQWSFIGAISVSGKITEEKLKIRGVVEKYA